MNQVLAAAWIIFGMFLGTCNDIWVKLLKAVPSTEISCGRFFFSTITLLPFALLNKNLLKSKYKQIHFFRGFIFLLAITLWEIGIKSVEIATVTLIGSSASFFLLILSRIFLKEKITVHRLFATGLSFLIILGIIDFKNVPAWSSFMILLCGNFFFALSDILNKKYATSENHFTSIFFYSFFAFLMSIPLSVKHFVIPTPLQIFNMLCLGIEANLYMLCLLKGFALADATFLTPFKYFEFIFSVLLGYILFSETPSRYYFIAIFIIIMANLWLLFHEKNSKK